MYLCIDKTTKKHTIMKTKSEIYTAAIGLYRNACANAWNRFCGCPTDTVEDYNIFVARLRKAVEWCRENDLLHDFWSACKSVSSRCFADMAIIESRVFIDVFGTEKFSEFNFSK